MKCDVCGREIEEKRLYKVIEGGHRNRAMEGEHGNKVIEGDHGSLGVFHTDCAP